MTRWFSLLQRRSGRLCSPMLDGCGVSPLGAHIACGRPGSPRSTTAMGNSGRASEPNSSIAAPVPLERISPHLIEATVSTEDNSFWGHTGFDVRGLVRAAWSNYAKGDSTTGGSTITQQLVKTSFFTTDCSEVDGVTQCYAPRTVGRKLKELVLAVETDDLYSKEQILEWYLNSISYSGRYVGAEAASEGYFRKPAVDLTLAEAALLAGIPSAPTQYNPRANCEAGDSGVCSVDSEGRTVLAGEAKARQEYVLDLMVKHGRLTPAAAEEAKAEVVRIAPPGTGLKANAFIDNQVQPRLVRMCEAGLLPKPHGAETCEESVHTAGYRVTTTLDLGRTRGLRSPQQYLAGGLSPVAIVTTVRSSRLNRRPGRSSFTSRTLTRRGSRMSAWPGRSTRSRTSTSRAPRLSRRCTSPGWTR